MIELTEKTQQDFLNRKWVQKLLDVGVDMSDAKYRIYNGFNGKDYITLESQLISCTSADDIIPTYTVSELLYKLHEWIYPTIDGIKYSGGLKFFKDAPFYVFYYDLKSENSVKKNDTYISAEGEYPIESLAWCLYLCHVKKDELGIYYKSGKPCPDTGNISDK